MDILHEPLTLILRHILATSALPRSGRVLDLASGAGLKLPLLAEACGPAVTFLALDHDIRITHHRVIVSSCHRVIADAHALPLAEGCCTAACCIAALGLFAAPVTALREVRRVVQPGGALLLVSGTQAWAAVTRWPAGVAGPLAAAYAKALARGMPAPAAPDLDDDLAAQLDAAGWHAPHTRAFLLDAADAVQAELALLPWPLLRPLVVAHLDAALLAACDEAAAHGEIELCTLVRATLAGATNE